jgi:hypothetical protein
LASAIEPPKPPEKEEPPRPEKKVEPPGPEKKVEPPAKKAEPPKPEKKVAPAKPEKKKEPPKPAKSPKKEVKAAAKKTAPEPVELKEDKVKRFLKAGQAAYQKGDYKGAMASYARAQALDPKNQLARMLMERAKAKIK